jgi:hypothetical protein
VTTVIARLILAMLILPASMVVFLLGFIIVVALASGRGPISAGGMAVLWTVVYSFIATYWLLLWRSSVRWTRARVRNTIIAGLVAITGGGAFASALMVFARQLPPGIDLLIGGVGVPVVWVLATVLLWRETPAERLARMSNLVANPTVLCPVCGYNLSGLREARCPECGATFTLDVLAASQPQREEHPAEL